MFTKYYKQTPIDQRRRCPLCGKPVPYHGMILCIDCR
jgi:hypothetical protein